MRSYIKVGNDILKEWFNFKKEELSSFTCKEDKEHFIYFEQIFFIMFLVAIMNIFKNN